MVKRRGPTVFVQKHTVNKFKPGGLTSSMSDLSDIGIKDETVSPQKVLKKIHNEKKNETVPVQKVLKGIHTEEDDGINPKLRESFQYLNKKMSVIQLNAELINKIEERYELGSKQLYSNGAKKVDIIPNIEPVKTLSEFSFDKIDEDHSISLASKLQAEFNRPLTTSEMMVMSVRNSWFNNMQLQIDETTLQIDRYIFEEYANAFANNNNSSIELPSDKVPMRLMDMVYNWLINDNDEIVLNQNFLGLYTLGKFLDIGRLQEQFWFTFAKSNILGFWEQGAFEAFLEARQMRQISDSMEDMMAILLSRVQKSFLPVVGSKEFLQLNVNEVIFLLKLDTICVNSEDEVFFAAVRWLEYKWTRRMQFVVPIMDTIRFRFLSPWLQQSIVNKPENEVIRFLRSIPQIRAKIRNACLYGEAIKIFKHYPSAFKNKFLESQFNQNNEVQRVWIYSRFIPHHHDVKCGLFRPLTYETFKLFLIRLHSRADEFMTSFESVPQKHWNSFKCCKFCKGNNQNYHKKIIPFLYRSH